MLKCIPIVIPIALALNSFSVCAGGSTFKVTVSKIVHNEANFRFTAILKEPFNYDAQSDCKEIIVEGDFDAAKWQKYTRLINRNIHLESLSILRKASMDSETLHLGYIGAGFHKISKCHFRSKGLFHDNGNVFSIYGSI